MTLQTSAWISFTHAGEHPARIAFVYGEKTWMDKKFGAACQLARPVALWSNGGHAVSHDYIGHNYIG